MDQPSRLAALRRAIQSETQRLRREIAGVWSRTLRRHGATPADEIYRFEPLEKRQYLHAPSIATIPDFTATQGTQLEVDASYYHADWDQPPTGQIDYGDGTTDSLVVGSEGARHGEAADAHIYQVPGLYTPTLTLSDADGNSSLVTFNITVDPAVPSISVGGEYGVTEGSPFELSLAAGEYGGNSVSFWSLDFGDGAGTVTLSDGFSENSLAYSDFATDNQAGAYYVYGAAGTYTIGITAEDQYGTYATSVAVAVSALPPSLYISGDYEAVEGSEYWLSFGAYAGSYSDNSVQSFGVNWGDGTTDSLGNIGDSGTDTHVFSTPGDTASYDVEVTAYAEQGDYTADFTVAVTPTPLSVGLAGPGQAYLGETYSLSFFTTGYHPAESWYFDWGDGVEDAQAGGTATHVYGSGESVGNSDVTITATAYDAGTSYVAVAEVEVEHSSPGLYFSGDYYDNEESPYSFGFSGDTDPAGDTIQSWELDYGDSATGFFNAGPSGAAGAHTYSVPGTYTMELTAFDYFGSYETSALAVVNHVAPSLTLGGDFSATQGTPFSFSFVGSEAGAESFISFEVDYGDGNSDTIGNGASDAGDGGFFTHTFDQGNADETINVTAWDDYGSYATSEVIDVVHPAPSLALDGAYEIGEGTSYGISFSASELTTDAVNSWSFFWGDGASVEAYGSAGTLSHTFFNGPATYTIDAVAYDDYGSYSEAFAVQVDAEPPSGVTFWAGSEATVGVPFTLDYSASAYHSLSWLMDWGDGATSWYTGSAGEATHVYLGESYGSPDYINVYAFDDATSYYAGSLYLVPGYAPPTVTLAGDYSASEGQAYTLSFSANDPDPAGVTAWTLDWGDNSTDVLDWNTSAGAFTHAYMTDGVFSIGVTANDEYSSGWTDAILEVAPAPPSLSLGGDLAATVGTPFNISFSANELYGDSASYWVMDYDDGSPPDTLYTGDAGSDSHYYGSVGSFDVVATAVDQNGSYSIDQWIDVSADPTLTPGGSSFAYIGDTYQLSLGVANVAANESLYSFSVDWGDGATSGGYTSGAVAEHVYSSAGPMTIGVSGDDEYAGVLSATLDLVAGEPSGAPGDGTPTLFAVGNASVEQSGTYSLGFSAAGGQVSDFVINWGDGSSTNVSTSDDQGSATHVFSAGPTNEPIEVYGYGPDGGYSVGMDVSVEEPPPELYMRGDYTVTAGMPYELSIIANALDPVTSFQVGWGDGSSDNYDFGFDSGVVGGYASHTYTAGPSEEAVTLTAFEGASSYAISADIDVVLDRDTVGLSQTYSASYLFGPNTEGTPFSLSFGASVSSAFLGWLYGQPIGDSITGFYVNWGDGSSESYVLGSEGAWETHAYSDAPSAYWIAVTAEGEHGEYRSGELVQVVPAAPSLYISLDQTSIAAGATEGISFSASLFPDHNSVTAWDVFWGDGATSAYAVGADGTVASHAYLEPSSYGIGVYAFESDGDSYNQNAGSYLTVGANSGSYNITEGQVFSFGSTIAPATETFIGSVAIDYAMNWGDSNATVTTATVGVQLGGSGYYQGYHQYEQDGTYSVAFDTDDGVATSFTVTVANVLPAIGAPTLGYAADSLSVSLSATFFDPGALDAHSAWVDWGDGSTAAATLSEPAYTTSLVTYEFGEGTDYLPEFSSYSVVSEASSGFLSASHSYASAGAYSGTLFVSDTDEGAPGSSGTAFADFSVSQDGFALEIDSENSESLAVPGFGDLAADAAIDKAPANTTPGKYITAEDYNLPGQGTMVNNVPAFAQGFGLNPSDPNQLTTGEATASFVPLVVHLPAGINLNDATLSLAYPDSDPGSVTWTGAGTTSDPYTYSLPADTDSSQADGIRLWTTDDTDMRTSASFQGEPDGGESTLGFFVPPSSDGGYTVSDLEKLGFTEDSSTGIIENKDVTLWVEAVKPSTKLGDQIVTGTFVESGDSPVSYSVHLTAAGADLLDDADNSTQPGGTPTPTPTPTPSSSDPELPTDTAALEAIKDDPNQTGKIIVVNSGDKNGNGVPDFADGYGLNLSGVSGVTESLPDDTSNPSEHFVPIELNVPPVADPGDAQVTFFYDGSDPGGVILSADSSGNLVYTPAPGTLRLWTKVGSYQDGNEDSPRTVDNYVVPGATYSLADLGYTSDDASADKPLVLYVEAVRAGTSQIAASVQVAADMASLADVVKVTAINAQAIGSAAYSGAVDLADGSVSLPATTDISTSGYGQPWGVSRTYTNALGLTGDGSVGNGWSMLPYLIQGDSTVIYAGAGQGAEYFDDTWKSDGTPIFAARFGVLDQLTYNSSADTYSLLDTSGDVTTFNGFGAGAAGNDAPDGAFLSYTDPNGNVTAASYNPVAINGGTQYQLDTITHGSDTFTYSWNGLRNGPATEMSAVGPDGMEDAPDVPTDGPQQELGQLASVTLAGPSGTIESVSYGYYGSSDVNGNPGDLQTATIKNAGGTTVGEDYYIYAGGGSGPDSLLYTFDSAAVALLIGHGFSLPLASTDSTDAPAMAPFADYAFTYGGGGMVATQYIQGAGGSSSSSLDAQGEYRYVYTPEGAGPVGVNVEQTQTVVSPPGQPDETIALNFAGEMLSSSTTDTGDPNGALDGKTWTTGYSYNADAQLSITTLPSGLKNVTDYYSGDDSGQPDGYVMDTKLISPGSDGSITALQSFVNYTSQTSGSYTIWLPAVSAVYANATSEIGDSSAQLTSYSYGFSGLAVSSEETTLPAVTDQGGGSTEDTTTASYNTWAWLTESIDAEDNDTDYSYDPATGFQTGIDQELGDGESDIVTSATDDIYGRPVFEVDADGNTSTISYSDGLFDSTVTTTPPSGAVTVEDDDAEDGTVTTTDTSGGTTLSETVEKDNYAGEEVEEQDYVSSGVAETTQLAYNAMGIENQTTEPNGTVDKTVFDNLGREFEQLIGNGSGAWTTDSEQIYDNNEVGDSDPTEQIEDPNGHEEITDDYNNWEDEQVATESGLGEGADAGVQKPLIDFTTINNLGQTLTDKTFDGDETNVGDPVNGEPQAPTDAGALLAETTYTPDALGGDSQIQTMDVSQSSGSIISTDTTTDTYDANQDLVSSTDSATGTVAGDSTQAVTTTTTDDAGRVTSQTTMVGSTFISGTDTQYDGDGNAIFVTNTVSQPSGGNRVTYTGNWYNSDAQLVTSVNYGTNGGTAMSSRPDTAPSRSTDPNAPQVTSYTYTPEGYTDTTTDPRGIVTKNYYDEQGNVTKTIDNYQGDGTPSAEYPDVNQTTEFTYNDDNELVDQTAVDPGGVNQTTENEYGPSGADNDNSLLLDVEYPDPNTGDPSSANEVKYTYNSDGTVATMTDRDGTVHAYSYDCDGNQIADVITTLGAGVDGTVTQRDTDYNDLGQPVDYTTKNAAGTILSQVKETYNGNGDVTSEAQSHNGAASTGTPTVGYGYEDTSGGQDRQTSLTYPDGRKIALGYGDTGTTQGQMTDAEGLVASVADANFSDGVVVTSGGSQTLANFSYMGDGTLVGQSRPQTGANEAITLDNFGDIADLNWTNSSSTSTDHFGLGYDADGNVMYKENYVLPGDSELYHANGTTPGYDGLNRLTTFSRGELSASDDGGPLDSVYSPGTTQSWTLDAVGNQTAVTTDGTTQTKTQNAQNQTTSVGGTGLDYDANGATTYDEAGRIWTYDAWGDPVGVANSDGEPMETEAYDALGRRITDTTYSGGSPTTSDVYYSTSGQVLEVDRDGSPVSQTVYSVGYVNSIIEVDQATGSPGTLNQRLYVQQDANYNVTSVTDTSGTVLERYIYSPYGEQTVLNPDGSVKGDGTPASSSYNLPQGYQGMLFDPVTSDNLTPNRVYDPMLGTWTSEDPSGYGNGADLYGFTIDNPANHDDPSGDVDEGGPARPLPQAPTYPRLAQSDTDRALVEEGERDAQQVPGSQVSDVAGKLMKAAGIITSIMMVAQTDANSLEELKGKASAYVLGLYQTGQLTGHDAIALINTVGIPGSYDSSGQGGMYKTVNWKGQWGQFLNSAIKHKLLIDRASFNAYAAMIEPLAAAKPETQKTKTGFIYYWPLTDEKTKDGQPFQRANMAFGVITPEMVGGHTNPPRITWPGWNGKIHARGHLVAAQIGGSNSDLRNFVMIPQNPTNVPDMSDFENSVRVAINAGETVRYYVHAIYADAGSAIPSRIVMVASGDRGFFMRKTIIVPGGG